MSAFVFAQSDGDNYGKLVVYEVPNTSAPSPGQAATLIQSDQFISSQFTLLGSSGSRVIQGNVQLIPIGDAIMYVRPVWILGEGSSTFPRYKFVAAAVGQRAVLGFDMNDAVTALVTGNPHPPADPGGVKSDGSQSRAIPTTDDHHDGAGHRRPRNRRRNASVDQLLQAAARRVSRPAKTALREQGSRAATSRTTPQAAGRGCVRRSRRSGRSRPRRPRTVDHRPTTVKP